MRSITPHGRDPMVHAKGLTVPHGALLAYRDAGPSAPPVGVRISLFGQGRAIIAAPAPEATQ